jgi:hypothetical protein
MNGALVFLVTRSLANVVLFRLKRLRQPKYFAGALIGAAYFYFYFFRFLLHGGASRGGAPFTGLSDLGPELGAVALFAVIIVFAWLWPGSRASLSFTEAEIAWLFPAPLDRPTLIRFKLLKSQLALLFLAFIMTFLTGRFALGPQAWTHLAGWWIVFSTLQLHRLGASFALQRLTARGLADGKRRLAVLLAVAALGGAIYFWQRAAPAVPVMHGPPRAEDWIEWLRAFVHAGPAPGLLLPFRLVVQPWAAVDFASFLRTLPAALAIMALHYFWVVRAHVSFEEASLARTQKRADFLAARRSGDLRILAPRGANEPLFRLRPTGFVPIAFVWKHALFAGGRRSFRRWCGACLALLAVALLLGQTGRWPSAPIVTAIIGLAVFLLICVTNASGGAQAVRRDLGAADLLKSFPVPGWQMVLGQLLGPVLAGTALQCFALAVIVASLASTPELSAISGGWPRLAVAVALLMPSFHLAMMIVPTLVTLLFPAWFKPGEQHAQGLEMMGLRLLMLFGQLLAVGLALLPAAILGGAAWMGCTMLGGAAWAPLAAAGAAAITLGAEAGMGVTWLGWLLDRYDVSEE